MAILTTSSRPGGLIEVANHRGLLPLIPRGGSVAHVSGAMPRALGELLANNAAFLSCTVSVSSKTDSQLGSRGILERQGN